MPSANRFAFMRDTVRSHPFLIASWAAMGGILLGGFVTLKMLQPESRAAKVGPAQAVAEARPAPTPVAETTGSAPAGASAAAVDCEHQTWPNLSRACMEAMRGKNRGPRVISTDTLDHSTISAIKSSPTAAPAEQPRPADPTPSAPVVASTAPAATKASATAEANPAPSTPAPSATAAAAPESSGALIGKALAEEKPSPPTDQKEAKQERHERVAKKAKRKPKFDAKVEPQALAKDQSDDGDDHVASADSNDRPSDDRVARGRADRRRIVDRWTERDYNVPSTDGRGDRRVTVIHRDNGGGIFGNLFGGFGN